VIRVPAIPTINAFEEEFVHICAFAKTLPGVDSIHVLPYHAYGQNKYAMLGREYPMGSEIKPLSKEDAAQYQKVVEAQGLRCSIGG
jgi:pyruvate formate lyase activating enzyme